MKRYRTYDIKWDTDGEVVDLPSEVFIELEADDDPSLYGADKISDKTGWCVNSFQFEEIKEKVHETNI